MKGIDASYDYEGYNLYSTKQLSNQIENINENEQIKNEIHFRMEL